ncbi:unnamed protein product [Rotaria socialis]
MSINNIVQAVTVELVKHDEMNRNQGSILTFTSINYYLNMQKCCSVCQIPYLETAQKQILTVLSGIFQTGMNAIMRLTGSGKPSLLDLLADRKDREVGYVVQDDIVSGNLTVKENLMFSANVRLSTNLYK